MDAVFQTKKSLIWVSHTIRFIRVTISRVSQFSNEEVCGFRVFGDPTMAQEHVLPRPCRTEKL